MSVIAHLLNKKGMAALVRATNDCSASQWKRAQADAEPCDDALWTWHAQVLPTLAALRKLAAQRGGEGFEAPIAESLEVAAWSERFLDDFPAGSPSAYKPLQKRPGSKSFKAESWQSCSEGFLSPLNDGYEEPPHDAEHEHDHDHLSDDEGDFHKKLGDLIAASPRTDADADSDPAFWEFKRGAAEHGWNEADARDISVRGPHYIEDRAKEQSAASLLEVVHIDLYNVEDPGGYPHVGLARGGVVQALRRRGEGRFLFVVTFCMQPLQMSVVFAAKGAAPGELLPRDAASGGGSPATCLLRRFVEEMSDEERSARFKVIPWVRAGPWVVRTAVGRTPAIIGKKLKLEFFLVPRDHFEVSVDVFSSAAAKQIVGLLQGAAKVLAMEVFFVLEGQEAGELPEHVLGGFRVMHGNLSRTRGPI